MSSLQSGMRKMRAMSNDPYFSQYGNHEFNLPRTSGSTRMALMNGKLYKGNTLTKQQQLPLFSEAYNLPNARYSITQEGVPLPCPLENKRFSYPKPHTTATARPSRSGSLRPDTRSLHLSGAAGDLNISESQLYPSIYFAKTSLRKLLKEICFPEQVKSLPPDDPRLSFIHSITQKLFHEISFELFNILICQHQITKNFVIIFSDAVRVPFSKCCNAPVQLELKETGNGLIRCNDKNCTNNILTEFVINFEQGPNLWQNSSTVSSIFTPSISSDVSANRTISKLIAAGVYKTSNLRKQVRKQQALSSRDSSSRRQSNLPFVDATQNQSRIQSYNEAMQTHEEEGGGGAEEEYQDNRNPFLTAQQHQQNILIPPEFQDHQFNKLNNDIIVSATQEPNSMISHKFVPHFSNPVLPNQPQQYKTTASIVAAQMFQQSEQQQQQSQVFHQQMMQPIIRQSELIQYNQKITSGLVSNSPVFNKDFGVNANHRRGASAHPYKWAQVIEKHEQRQMISTAQNSKHLFSAADPSNISSQYGSINPNATKRMTMTSSTMMKHTNPVFPPNTEDRCLLDIKNMINEILS